MYRSTFVILSRNEATEKIIKRIIGIQHNVQKQRYKISEIANKINVKAFKIIKKKLKNFNFVYRLNQIFPGDFGANLKFLNKFEVAEERDIRKETWRFIAVQYFLISI